MSHFGVSPSLRCTSRFSAGYSGDIAAFLHEGHQLLQNPLWWLLAGRYRPNRDLGALQQTSEMLPHHLSLHDEQQHAAVRGGPATPDRRDRCSPGTELDEPVTLRRLVGPRRPQAPDRNATRVPHRARHRLGGAPDIDTDPVAAWHDHVKLVMAAISDCRPPATAYDGHFGPTTVGDTIEQFYVWDMLVHRWDIARSVGAQTAL